MTPAATRVAEPDQACADAVDLARRAAEEVAGASEVGAHLAVEAEADRIATHLFACLSPAYVGWRWAVTVVRASRSRQVTVSEALLLPGPDSLLAPAWVPWTERVRPGDLKPGDLMPASADDERLTPAVVIEGAEGLLDWDASDVWTLGADLPGEVEPDLIAAEAASADLAGDWEPFERDRGRGRPSRRRRRGVDDTARPIRVLSAIGRDDAADRWYAGDHGPQSPVALAAPDHCLTCGFLVRLSGPLGRIFGVCANEYAPGDGQVVSLDHGCGAHSDPGRRAGDEAPAPEAVAPEAPAPEAPAAADGTPEDGTPEDGAPATADDQD